MSNAVVDDLINQMGSLFTKGVFTRKTVFRFSMDEETFTVTVDADCYSVERGNAGGDADCSCKTSQQMFKKIWFDGYQPGIMDFLSGKIQASAPLLLPQFLQAFGKFART
ncbi:hypothetical protein GMSM_21220 [Geomonas sp. Red276]